MLKSISWSEYFLLSGSLTAIWYVFLLLRYLTKMKPAQEPTFLATDRSDFVLDSSDAGTAKYQPPIQEKDYPVDGAENDEDLQLVMQTVIEEIRSCIFEVGEEGKEEELVPRLEVILANYEQLKKTAFKEVIDEFIMKEAKTVGFEYWDKEYVETFWK